MKVLQDKKAISLFLVPALVLYTVMVMVPILVSGYYSLLHWDGLGDKVFVGLENFTKLFGDLSQVVF